MTEESKQEVSELNFSGIQYLTDETFYGLLQRKASNKDIYEKIFRIDCSGCIHLTDQALKDIAITFPNLSEVCSFLWFLKLKFFTCQRNFEEKLLYREKS